MKTRILILMLAAFSLVSCKKEIEQEGTPVQDMAGEWFVRVYLNDDLLDDGYYWLSTYNTANFDTDSIWVNADYIWPFRGKVKVDYANLEFLSSDELGDYAVVVTGGKIFKNGATPPSKTTTDSIYIEFIDEDLDINGTDRWIMKGYRRTGFMEDEH